MSKVHSLRSRMMLLFVVAVGVLLAGSYAGFYLFLVREVHAQLDRELLEASQPLIADLVADDPAPPDDQDVSGLNLAGEYVELLDPSGRALQISMNLGKQALPLGGQPLDLSEPTFRTINAGSYGRLRVALIPFPEKRGPVVLVMARPTRGIEGTLQGFGRAILILLPLGLLLTTLISGWFVGRSLAPVSELTRQAARRADGVTRPGENDLWTPISVPDSHDELGLLAQTFNQLFERMAAVGHQLRQFVSDAAHELRTPLAVLQGETELILSQPRTAAEYQKTLRVIDGELKKLSRIVQGLFMLSMADARQLRLAKDPLYLDEVLEDACALATPSARAKKIALRRDLHGEVAYSGDEPILRQLFLIFLDNAIKYSPPNTCIQVTLRESDEGLQVAFEDQGIGISAEHLPHIFERFYRAAQPEAGESQSGGLGLAIAQAIVDAVGGSIACRSGPNSGSVFTVTLPSGAGKNPPALISSKLNKS
jgi:two-component system, OmpR family, sensor kinase